MSHQLVSIYLADRNESALREFRCPWSNFSDGVSKQGGSSDRSSCALYSTDSNVCMSFCIHRSSTITSGSVLLLQIVAASTCVNSGHTCVNNASSTVLKFQATADAVLQARTKDCPSGVGSLFDVVEVYTRPEFSVHTRCGTQLLYRSRKFPRDKKKH